MADIDHCFLCSFSVSHGFVMGRQMMQCRRRSPHAAPAHSTMAGFAAWPLVEERDWCGEFSAKSEQQRGSIEGDGK